MTTHLEEHSSRTLARPFVLAEATAAALVIWSIGWCLSVPFTVRSNGSDHTVGAASVAIVTVFAGLAAWALLAVLERYTARSRAIWTGVATGALAISLVGPAGSAVGTSTTITLVLTHLVVGAVLIVGLRGQSTNVENEH
jgi:hypothetical protein